MIMHMVLNNDNQPERQLTQSRQPKQLHGSDNPEELNITGGPE